MSTSDNQGGPSVLVSNAQDVNPAGHSLPACPKFEGSRSALTSLPEKRSFLPLRWLSTQHTRKMDQESIQEGQHSYASITARSPMNNGQQPNNSAGAKNNTTRGANQHGAGTHDHVGGQAEAATQAWRKIATQHDWFRGRLFTRVVRSDHYIIRSPKPSSPELWIKPEHLPIWDATVTQQVQFRKVPNRYLATAKAIEDLCGLINPVLREAYIVVSTPVGSRHKNTPWHDDDVSALPIRLAKDSIDGIVTREQRQDLTREAQAARDVITCCSSGEDTCS
ncbi:hypothetical protein F4860DRAFT_510837 [Xylaria cubensis]|nr:hypothetical protein F4860DRAFT_510837 [Xylaria cubensis]